MLGMLIDLVAYRPTPERTTFVGIDYSDRYVTRVAKPGSNDLVSPSAPVSYRSPPDCFSQGQNAILTAGGCRLTLSGRIYHPVGTRFNDYPEQVDSPDQDW